MPRKKKRSGMKFVLIVTVLTAAAIAAAVFLAQPEKIVSAKTMQIYFVKDGKPVPVERQKGAKAIQEYAAIEALLEGPTEAEKMSGMETQIPENTKLRRVSRSKNMVIADFTKELETYGGGTAKVQALIAQIVYTATALPKTEQIQILVEGKNEVSLGSEGYIIDRPLSRANVSKK